MTTEELNEALSDEAIYQRRKLILDALNYELQLVRQAITEIEVILDDEPRIAIMPEADLEKIQEGLSNWVDCENELDNAETAAFQSLSGDQMARYEKGAE
jgi:hypothetical protein